MCSPLASQLQLYDSILLSSCIVFIFSKAQTRHNFPRNENRQLHFLFFLSGAHRCGALRLNEHTEAPRENLQVLTIRMEVYARAIMIPYRQQFITANVSDPSQVSRPLSLVKTPNFTSLFSFLFSVQGKVCLFSPWFYQTRQRTSHRLVLGFKHWVVMFHHMTILTNLLLFDMHISG